MNTSQTIILSELDELSTGLSSKIQTILDLVGSYESIREQGRQIEQLLLEVKLEAKDVLVEVWINNGLTVREVLNKASTESLLELYKNTINPTNCKH